MPDVFYLVEPRPELRPHAMGRVADGFLVESSVDTLTRTEVWVGDVQYLGNEKYEPGWGPDEYTALTKLVCLAALSDIGTLAKPANFARLFDTDRLSVGLFDRWWTVRRLEDRPAQAEATESVEDYAEALMHLAHRVEPTGYALVDTWLDAVR